MLDGVKAVVASIVGHAALIGVLALMYTSSDTAPPVVEHVEITLVPSPPPAPAPTKAPASASTRSTARAPTKSPATRTRSRTTPMTTTPSVAGLLAAGSEIGFESGTGGTGGGGGGGNGTGNGLGIAATSSTTPAEIRIPQPKISKARPAKLIYPSRERDVEPGELFVANVDVDREGFVVGARMKSGLGPRRDDAAGLIFKFRYLPALDDEGKPIRSTFDQPFSVGP